MASVESEVMIVWENAMCIDRIRSPLWVGSDLADPFGEALPDVSLGDWPSRGAGSTAGPLSERMNRSRPSPSLKATARSSEFEAGLPRAYRWQSNDPAETISQCVSGRSRAEFQASSPCALRGREVLDRANNRLRSQPTQKGFAHFGRFRALRVRVVRDGQPRVHACWRRNTCKKTLFQPTAG